MAVEEPENNGKSAPAPPAASEWGLVILLLSGLISGTLVFGKSRPAID